MSISAAVAVQRSNLGNFDLPVDGVRLVPMPALVERVIGASVQAITLVRLVVINPSMYDRVVAGDEPELLAHELIHVAQWERYGVAGFLWHYLGDYIRLRMLGIAHQAAYRGIGFEYQAFAASHEIRERL